MKAIETVYDGHRFRSRLEARWAVFFNALGIRYRYETEGYDLGGGMWYLCDFWLPDLKYWVEVKPELFPLRDDEGNLRNPVDYAKMQRFREHLHSNDPDIRYFCFTQLAPESDSSEWLRYDGIIEWYYNEYPDESVAQPGTELYWVQCPFCQRCSIVPFGDMTGVNGLKCCEVVRRVAAVMQSIQTLVMTPTSVQYWWTASFNDIVYLNTSPQIVSAFRAARQARFEHGQSGAPHEWKGDQS